jgi:hypothetical protein
MLLPEVGMLFSDGYGDFICFLPLLLMSEHLRAAQRYERDPRVGPLIQL